MTPSPLTLILSQQLPQLTFQVKKFALDGIDGFQISLIRKGIDIYCHKSITQTSLEMVKAYKKLKDTHKDSSPHYLSF